MTTRESGIDPRFERRPYFKRELVHHRRSLLPISFAIPAEKLCSAHSIEKTRTFATCFPGHPATYVFDTQDAYYADYRGSLFAFTMKKHDWDCLRHYEILANRCLSLFFDLASCPPITMMTYPRSLCQEANALVAGFNAERYQQIDRAFFDYNWNQLTTRSLASHVVSKAS